MNKNYVTLDEMLGYKKGRKNWLESNGYKSSEIPWKNIKSSLFSSSEKKKRILIGHIRVTQDQILLKNIVTETDSLDICLAAVQNISDQEILEKLVISSIYPEAKMQVLAKIKNINVIHSVALNDKSPLVREKVIEYIEDADILRKIANEDETESVRNKAFWRIATPNEVKNHLISCSGMVVENHLSKITSYIDMVDIAILAKSQRVRKEASERIPVERPEGQLLRAAVGIGEDISVDSLLVFDDAYIVCKDCNPKFIERIALEYPDECVRFLARGRKREETQGTSFAEKCVLKHALNVRLNLKRLIYIMDILSNLLRMRLISLQRNATQEHKKENILANILHQFGVGIVFRGTHFEEKMAKDIGA